MEAVWVLWGLAVLQFAVARWWWKGPWMEGTKHWGAGLFIFNGLAGFLAGWRALLQPDPGVLLLGFHELTNRWSDLFLLGVGLAALKLSEDRDWLRNGLMILAGTGLVASTPLFFFDVAVPWSFDEFAQEIPLLLAIVVTVAALIRFRSSIGEESAWPWVLVLSVLGLRYAEVSTAHFSAAILAAPSAENPLLLVHKLAKFGTFLIVILGFGVVLFSRFGAQDELERMHLEVVTGFLLGGVLLGAARRGGSPSLTIFWLSLSLVRPLGFLAAQSHLQGDGFLRSRQWRRTAVGAGVFLASFVGLILALGPWGLPAGKSVLVAFTFLLVAAPLASTVQRSLPRTVHREPRSQRDVSEIEWPLDESVALPGNWRERTLDRYEEYLRLDGEVREELDELSQWQRILLVLEAFPDGEPAAYERSTPGLHFMTHTAYASIGQEIRRTNERWERVLPQLDVEPPETPVQEEDSLIEGRTGAAEGLDSSRAKIYRLTDLGQRVAESLRREIGLGEEHPRDVARAVAAGFQDAP